MNAALFSFRTDPESNHAPSFDSLPPEERQRFHDLQHRERALAVANLDCEAPGVRHRPGQGVRHRGGGVRLDPRRLVEIARTSIETSSAPRELQTQLFDELVTYAGRSEVGS